MSENSLSGRVEEDDLAALVHDGDEVFGLQDQAPVEFGTEHGGGRKTGGMARMPSERRMQDTGSLVSLVHRIARFQTRWNLQETPLFLEDMSRNVFMALGGKRGESEKIFGFPFRFCLRQASI
jgi:hypothetical protein